MSIFKRGRRTGSQIGVFVTPEGVAAAQVSAARRAASRGSSAASTRERGAQDPFARVVEPSLSGRRALDVSVLDPGGYHLLLVEAPDVPAEELRAAVRWRIKDLIDFHIDDAVIDVFEMPRHARGGANRMMYAVTAKAEFVKQQIELDRKRRAQARRDRHSGARAAQYRDAARDPRSAAPRSCTSANRRSTLLLVRQGVLYLDAPHRDRRGHARRGRRAAPELVAGLALEVRRSLDYFESHYEQTSIQQLHVSGLEACRSQSLARDLGIAVHEVDLTDAVRDRPKTLSPELQRLCMPAIGAALRHDPVAL